MRRLLTLLIILASIGCIKTGEESKDWQTVEVSDLKRLDFKSVDVIFITSRFCKPCKPAKAAMSEVKETAEKLGIYINIMTYSVDDIEDVHSYISALGVVSRYGGVQALPIVRFSNLELVHGPAVENEDSYKKMFIWSILQNEALKKEDTTTIKTIEVYEVKNLGKKLDLISKEKRKIS